MGNNNPPVGEIAKTPRCADKKETFKAGNPQIERFSNRLRENIISKMKEHIEDAKRHALQEDFNGVWYYLSRAGECARSIDTIISRDDMRDVMIIAAEKSLEKAYRSFSDGDPEMAKQYLAQTKHCAITANVDMDARVTLLEGEIERSQRPSEMR